MSPEGEGAAIPESSLLKRAVLHPSSPIMMCGGLQKARDRLFDNLDISWRQLAPARKIDSVSGPVRKVTLGAMRSVDKDRKSEGLGQRSRKSKTHVCVKLEQDIRAPAKAGAHLLSLRPNNWAKYKPASEPKNLRPFRQESAHFRLTRRHGVTKARKTAPSRLRANPKGRLGK